MKKVQDWSIITRGTTTSAGNVTLMNDASICDTQHQARCMHILFHVTRRWRHRTTYATLCTGTDYNLAFPATISDQVCSFSFLYVCPSSQYRLSSWSFESGFQVRFFKTSLACLKVAPVSILPYVSKRKSMDSCGYEKYLLLGEANQPWHLVDGQTLCPQGLVQCPRKSIFVCRACFNQSYSCRTGLSVISVASQRTDTPAKILPVPGNGSTHPSNLTP